MGDFFNMIWETINGWFDNIFGLDDFINEWINYFFNDVDPLFRLLILIFLAIIIVLGTISFIKKVVKVFIVLILIVGLYFLLK